MRRGTACQQRFEFHFDAVVRRSKDLAPGHDDNIDRGDGFVMTEQLADQALGAVTLDSSAHFPGRCYTETGGARLAFPREHGHEASRALETGFIDELEIRSLANMFAGEESLARLPWAWGVRLGAVSHWLDPSPRTQVPRPLFLV